MRTEVPGGTEELSPLEGLTGCSLSSPAGLVPVSCIGPREASLLLTLRWAWGGKAGRQSSSGRFWPMLSHKVCYGIGEERRKGLKYMRYV